MSLCTYQKQCELRSSRQWWWDSGVVKMSKYFKKRSPNVAPLDSTICIIAMPSSMCTVDGLTRWNRKLRNACINTRIRVYKYTKIRDEHGASFQSLKINRMLITRPFAYNERPVILTIEVLLFFFNYWSIHLFQSNECFQEIASETKNELCYGMLQR